MYVNQTDHAIHIYDQTGKTLLMKVPPYGKVARVNFGSEFYIGDKGVPIYLPRREVLNLLPERGGDIIIVSFATLIYAPKDRQDILAPGEKVKTRQRGIIGCKGLRSR